MPEDVIVLGQEIFELDSSIQPITDFFSYYDSGLMIDNGTGVILHRYGYGSEQIVYQMEPQIKGVTYKQSESSYTSRTYSLAFPFVILAISYEKGIFRGVRHYYSPTPIYSLDQPLYLPNLPNTNCKGYNNTSVGWVCIYHQVHEKFTTVTQKLDYALTRYDPMGEPYNYNNMPETDGYNFYKEHKRPEWNWMPSRWAKRTEEKGLDWVLDPDSWILLLTDDAGEQYVTESEPLTLRRALYDTHYTYYREYGAVQLNAFARLTTDIQRSEFNKKLIRTALVAGVAKVQVKKTIHDILGAIVLPSKTKSKILQLGFSKLCSSCGETHHLDNDVPSNVITALSGLYSSASKYDVRIDWYCPLCYEDATVIPTNLLKKMFVRLDTDGHCYIGQQEEATASTNLPWKSISKYDDTNNHTEHPIKHVISSADLISFKRDLLSDTTKKIQQRCIACDTSWMTSRVLMTVYDVIVASDYKNYVLKEIGCRYCLKEIFINPYLGVFTIWKDGLPVAIKQTDVIIAENWPLREHVIKYFLSSQASELNTLTSYAFASHVLYTLLGEEVDLYELNSRSSKVFHEIFYGIALTNAETIDVSTLKKRLAMQGLLKNRKVENIDH